MNIVVDLSEKLIKKEYGRQSEAKISFFTVSAPHLFKRGVFRTVSGFSSVAIYFISAITVGGSPIAVCAVYFVDEEPY